MHYDNVNNGVLFKNESENEKAPNYKGKLNVEGAEYEIAAWVREAKSGNGKFLSLKIQPKQKKHNPEPKIASIDSDVPW